MNTPTKKLILIIAALLSGMALMSSCSKNTEAAKAEKAAKAKQQAVEQAAKKAKKISQAAAATTAFSDGKNSLNAARDGQYVTLNWQIDPTIGKIQKIDIWRSPTGTGKRTKVADLDIQVTSHKDCLPNADAFWYWVRIHTTDAKNQDLGPVKVEADKAGASHYINVVDNYKASVTRTLELATLTWDFPAGEYKAINITRSKRPVEPSMGTPGASVLTTLAAKSQSTDALPDANTEYWYSFQIILKSGAIVYKGPIKAEYVGSRTKKSRGN